MQVFSWNAGSRHFSSLPVAAQGLPNFLSVKIIYQLCLDIC